MKSLIEFIKENFKLGWVTFAQSLFTSVILLFDVIGGIVMVATTPEWYLKILWGLLFGILTVCMFIFGAQEVGADKQMFGFDCEMKLMSEILDKLRGTNEKDGLDADGSDEEDIGDVSEEAESADEDIGKVEVGEASEDII